MAPTRKLKGVNRRVLNSDVVSPEKEFGKSHQRKRKSSHKLGPRWDTDEISLFYHGYRKYGKDWKKVAASVHNRSAEMVEALYNMNRAYLSLPEGTASVAGLVAMMIDHYNNEGSDSEGESGNALTTSQKSLKRKRGKIEQSIAKENTSQTLSIDSNDGCHSFLKRQRVDGVPPSALRKRTPRVHVSYLYKKNEIENNVSMNRTGQKLDVDANNEEGAHVAALALTEGLQRAGSPQVSQSSSKRKEQLKFSPIQSSRRMNMESKAARGGLHDAPPKEGWWKGNVGSNRTENAEYVRDNTSSLVAMEGVGTVEVQKGEKFYGKKKRVQDASSQFDDGGEACSGTEGGLVSGLKKNVNVEVSIEKRERSSPHGQKRRTKKLFFGDESSALDALQTLASVSLATNMDAESSIQLREESKRFDVDAKSSVAEATSTCVARDRGKSVIKEKPVKAFSGVESSASKNSKLGRNSIVHPNSLSVVERPQQPSNKAVKRKRASKIVGSEPREDLHLSNPSKTEGAAQEGSNSAGKGKRSTEILSLRRWRSGGIPEGHSNGDMKGGINDSVVPAPLVQTACQSSLPTKYVSKRKLSLKKLLNGKALKCSEHVAKHQPNKFISSSRGSLPYLKEKMPFCLSSPLLRQWCTFEWFYSAIDYPWFAKREFVEYLNHVGLGHIQRLTRVEWSVIRSSLGKPRRFSERFLYEERGKLKQYRESVRRHYYDLHTGTKNGLPTDLARPLSVGQRVVALHPRTREVHDGSILTVDQDKFRVQFDSHDLGVELVMDIDCMPSNLLQNMPESIRKQKNILDKFAIVHKEQQVNGHLNYGGPIVLAPGSHMEVVSSPLNSMLKPVKEDVHQFIFQQKEAAAFDSYSKQAAYNQPSVSRNQAREADIQVISQLSRALSKKEALLGGLQTTNDEILERQKNADVSLKESEIFKKHYAMVLVQLKEASGQASSALIQMRERNTYPSNSLPSCPPAQTNSIGPNSLQNSYDEPFPSQEHGSTVAEILKASRLKARIMVDAAIQAMSSTKDGDDVFKRIGEALNSVEDQQSIFGLKLPVIGSPEQSSVSMRQGNHPNSYADGCASHLQDDLNKSYPQIPSELIASCVSTLLMIQACTERQYPPADVAKIIDSAVTSLYPSCPQNLQIYREIQMSMGRLKTQILALVPS